ncbi:MAG: non-homologous end-joining DNA ligase [Nannocystaceae bacterium]|nr:non-homologous end-joining DNA ligase [Myxococcales bacterium]
MANTRGRGGGSKAGGGSKTGGGSKRSSGKRASGITLTVGEREIDVSSPDSVMFPDDGITKRQLVEYYLHVSEVMVPHVRGRALTIERFPKGIGGKGFLQKQAADHYPPWIPRVRVPGKQGRDVDYPVANDPAALVYLANQRCVTFHITSAPARTPETPDQVIFDFDPQDGSQASFEKVRQCAGIVGEELDRLGLRTFLKTSGSRGLHVIAPIEPELDVDDVRAFARAIGERLATKHPRLMTVEMLKKDRGDRVFVDYLRNGYAQTVVAPYTVRARPGAPVSTPLTWDELTDSDLNAQKYKIGDVLARLGKMRDPWHELAKHARSLPRARAKLGS